ncbi:hypothetical protein MHTCC0001_12850 [Flavobacteriaceae bacterium MHTCC 0001]
MKKYILILFLPFLGITQVQIGQDLNGDIGSNSDLLGSSVSLSSNGNIMAVGAPDSDANGFKSGQVKVYEHINGTWIQMGDAINGETPRDGFGTSVSLSSNGSIIAIGALNDNTNGIGSGQVKVYENINGIWTQLGNDINGEAEGDGSGGSISLSSDGTIVAIGARGNDGNGNNSGHVRIYKNINGIWTQLGNDIDGEAEGDESGGSISLSSDGTIVAIGARANTRTTGHVRIYSYDMGVWTQIGEDIDGERFNDFSGMSVSLSSDGSVVAIGAFLNDGNGTSSGHVRVYKNELGTWTQIGDDIDGAQPGERLGNSVSLSSDGSILAIGADNAVAGGVQPGLTRIYKNMLGIWVQLGADILGEAVGDIPKSISLSSNGNIIAIGVPFNDGNGINSGHVRTFEYINNGWLQIGSDIDGINGFKDNQFGTSVSLSADGSIMAVGAPKSDGNMTNSGYVRVYENLNGMWSQTGNTINGEATFDDFGISLSLSSNGDIIAIGAKGHYGNNGIVSGHVQVYENIGGVWTQVGNDIEGEAAFNNFGFSVSLSSNGTIVAVGAPFNEANGFNSGHVQVYENIGGVWTQIGNDIEGEAQSDSLGFSASLSSDGTIVAVGVIGDDSNGSDSGKVQVFKNINNDWIQIGDDIDGESAGDQFGYSVNLSSNGSNIAIGTLQNGNYSGYVKVYENIGGIWTQVGDNIDGEAAGDQSGYSVSLSSDGTIVAIGARGNDGNGSNSGHVRLYQNINNVWTQIGNDIDGKLEESQSGSVVSLSSNGAIVGIGAPFNDENGSYSGQVRVFDMSSNILFNDEKIKTADILVFPNPVKDIVTVTSNETIDHITLLNLQGVKVLESKSKKINLSNFPKGVYIIQIASGSKKRIQKLILQ